MRDLWITSERIIAIWLKPILDIRVPNTIYLGLLLWGCSQELCRRWAGICNCSACGSQALKFLSRGICKFCSVRSTGYGDIEGCRAAAKAGYKTKKTLSIFVWHCESKSWCTHRSFRWQDLGYLNMKIHLICWSALFWGTIAGLEKKPRTSCRTQKMFNFSEINSQVAIGLK